uniref:NADH-ubiquinone oxidoreductase chain 3 n=1 Tax=Pisione sp. YZ-2018 TaxID=2153337 RepID=A0A343W6H9_9ANNE|nr:NADH dehydrogenase subunit 3 [Pisione sp. YZ-2018]
MFISFSMGFVALALPMIVLSLALIISARSSQDREKCSPFECGFDPKNNARIPFSLRFFLLAVIFIVFDIEIVLLMPIPLISISIPLASSLLGIFLFFLILILGLLHEWREGSLEWAA